MLRVVLISDYSNHYAADLVTLFVDLFLVFVFAELVDVAAASILKPFENAVRKEIDDYDGAYFRLERADKLWMFEPKKGEENQLQALRICTSGYGHRKSNPQPAGRMSKKDARQPSFRTQVREESENQNLFPTHELSGLRETEETSKLDRMGSVIRQDGLRDSPRLSQHRRDVQSIVPGDIEMSGRTEDSRARSTSCSYAEEEKDYFLSGRNDFPGSPDPDKAPSEQRPSNATRPSGSRRGSLLSQASAKALSLTANAKKAVKRATNVRKIKTMVKVLGLHRRVQNEAKMEEEEEVSGDKLGTLKPAVRKSEKNGQESTPPKFRESRRINMAKGQAPTTPRQGGKQDRERKAIVDAKKHENLVDQLKLRKKTHTHDQIQAKMTKLSEEHQTQFDDSMVFGCLKVWHPTSPPLRYWDLIIAVLVFSQILMVPFQLASFPGADSNGLLVANMAMDCIFLVDIFVQFKLAVEKGEQGYYGDDVDLVTDRKTIAKMYLHGWFAIDFLAVSPLFVTIFGTLLGWRSETTNLLKLIKAARLPRLFRLMRIFRVLRTVNMRSKEMQWLMYSRYSYLLNVFYLLIGLFCMVHVYACLWYVISELNIGQRFIIAVKTWNPPLTTDGHYDEDFAEDTYKYDSSRNKTVFVEASYTMAFHQAVLMIMGESMDMETDEERWMSSLLMIVGAVIMAIVFGEVSMYITNFYASSNMFQKKMTDLYESMEALGLPQSLQERIHLFYKYVWDEHHSIDGRPAILTFVPELSTNLAKEIYLYLFSDMITKVPMFHNRPADVVQHLVLAVQTLIYMPKDYVIVKGEFGQEMFFIQSGKCDVIIEVTTPLPPRVVQQKSGIGRLSIALKDGTKRLKKAGTFNFVNNFKTRMTHHAEHHEDSDDEATNSSPSGRQSTTGGSGSQRFSNRISINGTMYKVMEKSVKELDTGSYFGEIALIIDSRRTASIRSRTFTELLVLTREDFLRITENNHEDREEMKNQIKARYQTDRNVKKALENQGKESAKEKEEKEKHMAMKGLEAKVGRRQSFLEIHASSHNHNQNQHKSSLVDSEIHELKGALRNMTALMSRTSATVEEMGGRERERRAKARRRKAKLNKARKEREGVAAGGGLGKDLGSPTTRSTVDSKPSKDSPTSGDGDGGDDPSSEDESEVGTSTEEEEEGDVFDVNGPLPGMVPHSKSSGSSRGLLADAGGE